jgi:hypothetical protein
MVLSICHSKLPKVGQFSVDGTAAAFSDWIFAHPLLSFVSPWLSSPFVDGDTDFEGRSTSTGAGFLTGSATGSFSGFFSTGFGLGASTLADLAGAFATGRAVGAFVIFPEDFIFTIFNFKI